MTSRNFSSNFSPHDVRSYLRWCTLSLILLALLCAILVSIYGYTYYRITALQYRKSQIVQASHDHEILTKEYTRLRTEHELLIKNKNLRDTLFLSYLDALTRALPVSVKLDELSYKHDKKEFVLTGTARTAYGFQEFIRAMEHETLLKMYTITEVRQTNTKRYLFKILIFT